MIRSLRHRAFALLSLLVLALGATGLAHRAPSIAAEELSALLRMGVTLDDICGMEGMAEGAEPCPLCRIDPGYLPPAPPQIATAALLESDGLSTAEASYPVPHRVRPSIHGPRAPPLA